MSQRSGRIVLDRRQGQQQALLGILVHHGQRQRGPPPPTTAPTSPGPVGQSGPGDSATSGSSPAMSPWPAVHRWNSSSLCPTHQVGITRPARRQSCASRSRSPRVRSASRFARDRLPQRRPLPQQHFMRHRHCRRISIWSLVSSRASTNACTTWFSVSLSTLRGNRRRVGSLSPSTVASLISVGSTAHPARHAAAGPPAHRPGSARRLQPRRSSRSPPR